MIWRRKALRSWFHAHAYVYTHELEWEHSCAESLAYVLIFAGLTCPVLYRSLTEPVCLPSVYPELQMGQSSLTAWCELPPQQDLPAERFPAAAPKIRPLENTFSHLLQVSTHATFKLSSYVASLLYGRE